jgi:hypothetical protein
MESEEAAGLRQRHERTLIEILDEGVAAGVFRALPRRTVVKLVFGALNAVPLWLKDAADLDEVVDVALALLLDGLGTR